MGLCARACVAAVLLLAAHVASAATAPSCQSSDVYGKAWLVEPAVPDKPSVHAFLWPLGDDPRRSAWLRAAPQTCANLPPDAGVILYTPVILKALSQGSGGTYLRQMMFRLGVERFGDARMQLRQTTSGRIEGRGSMAWPSPHKGPLSALGTAQPVARPAVVPADALGFGVVSVSPGRAWQQLEAFAGGLWPLEATLVGTQITAWEQGAGNGLLADDILGYASQAWTGVLLAGAKSPSLAWMLPVAKPQMALSFAQWAVEIVSGFAPSLQARMEKVQGQSMLVLRGLVRATSSGQTPLYVAASKDALFVSTEAASVLKLQKAAAAQTAAEPVDADAPKDAMVFGRVDHAAITKALGRRATYQSWMRALHLDPEGRTFGYVDATPDEWRWRTSSTAAPAALPIPKALTR